MAPTTSSKKNAGMKVDGDRVQSFSTPEAFCSWLETNHATENELWMKLYKKASRIPTISWEAAVIEALAWGWIDSTKKSFDEQAYLQRFSPRRKKSNWSKKNCEHAEKLVKDGRMQPAGLQKMNEAKADGRWDAAYAGSASMEIPDDFLEQLNRNRAAKKMFQTLNRTNLFSIYHQLHSAKKEETRQRRIDKIIAMLARGETFH